jgi:hypothetical protein
MGNIGKYLLLWMVIVAGAAVKANATPEPSYCSAAVPCRTAPEVDPSMAVVGISLLAGSIAILRARSRN